jgi:hypothetical protein
MTSSAFIFMTLAVLMFTFGTWGRTHAAKLAARETVSSRREGRQKSLRKGGITWQIVAAICFLMSLVDTIRH